ncbi:hypothetical protein [Acidaminococcus sp.]|uniref:hypothetical protein n=1 Tax=Acidaminococcus sp. TaxID=1872103 RepID=UPI003AB31EE2
MTELNHKSRRQYWQERAAAVRKKGGVTEDLIKEYMMDQQQQFLEVLEEIGMLGKAGNLRKALRKIRRVVEGALPEKNDQLISKALDHPLEYLVYPIFFAQECEGKKFTPAPLPLGLGYHLWGGILMDLGKPDDAYKRFEQSLMWSPFSYANYYPMNRILEEKGDFSGWLQNIRREYEHAIYRRNLMGAYGELARYYLLTKETEKAAAIREYMKTHPIMDALPSYWDKAMDAAMDTFSPETLPAFATVVQAAGLGGGPHKRALAALDEVAERALSLHQEDTAERVYAYLYDLTQDSQYEAKAAHIEKANCSHNGCHDHDGHHDEGKGVDHE